MKMLAGLMSPCATWIEHVHHTTHQSVEDKTRLTSVIISELVDMNSAYVQIARGVSKAKPLGSTETVLETVTMYFGLPP